MDIVHADSGDESDKAWDDVRVIHVERLCYWLEAIQQCLCVLWKENALKNRFQEKIVLLIARVFVTHLPRCWLLYIGQQSAQFVVQIT